MGLMRMYGSHPIHGDAFDLEQKLYNLDPRLQLKYITREHPHKPGVMGRRYEVHRTNEDGTESMIGHWKLDEFDQIWLDVVLMKDRAEGRAPGVEDEIDTHNAKIEADISRQIRDNMGETLEYAGKLWHDTNNPKNVFRGIPGFRDQAKREADKTAEKTIVRDNLAKLPKATD